MNGLGFTSALASGLVVGLVTTAVAPEDGILLGLGVGAGFSVVVLLARALVTPDEDTEPEIRPPDFYVTRHSRGGFATEEDDQ